MKRGANLSEVGAWPVFDRASGGPDGQTRAHTTRIRAHVTFVRPASELNTVLAISLSLLGLCPSGTAVPSPEEVRTSERADELYVECGLNGLLDASTFRSAYASVVRHHASSHILALADMTRPSTEKRLYIIDLASRKLLFRTWVAHGRNSGDLNCTSVSNTVGSLQTSKGLYRVEGKIISPKHGAALLLQGLDPGVNDKAMEREIIMHGAEYVSAAFIQQYGRLGRSYGCPAVPVELMPRFIDLLADGGLLYIYTH